MESSGGIRLRAHHLLCIHGFRGQGYSPLFVANMARLVDRLGTSPDTEVQIVNGVDDICAACPHLGDGVCSRSGELMDALDLNVSRKLSLSNGQRTDWTSILQAIRDNIDPFRLDDVCQGCSWLDLDYCTNGLADMAGIQADED